MRLDGIVESAEHNNADHQFGRTPTFLQSAQARYMLALDCCALLAAVPGRQALPVRQLRKCLWTRVTIRDAMVHAEDMSPIHVAQDTSSISGG